jgi:NTE family protein
MSPETVIADILTSADTEKTEKNVGLLKKIILIASMGRLMVNGQSPDNTVSLAHYLFDSERVMIDLTRLSGKKKKQFESWLLDAHPKKQGSSAFSSASVNEYRGYTAEETLNWVGIIKRILFGPYVKHWVINQRSLTLNYQLLGIDAIKGQNGILIGFDQIGEEYSKSKYRKSLSLDNHEYMGNTKRIVLTNDIVSQLLSTSLASDHVSSLCQQPHPLAIHIEDKASYYQNMHDHRLAQKYSIKKPWYVHFWNWIISLFNKASLQKKLPDQQVEKTPEAQPPQCIYHDDTTNIYLEKTSKKVIVYEKRPDIENLVLCGGGPKIYGHIGVWKALNKRGIVPKRFAGSSAGAIISLFCYLGYQADEMKAILRHLKQEHLLTGYSQILFLLKHP